MAIGLLFYVKALLIVPVVGFLALGYFAPGPAARPARRRASALARRRRRRPARAAYLGYYVTHVSSPSSDAPGVVGPLADNMLGTAFASRSPAGRGAGRRGPAERLRPPADWTVHLAWVLVVLVVLYGALRRRRTLRAWVLLAGYLAALLLLLLTSRAPRLRCR